MELPRGCTRYPLPTARTGPAGRARTLLSIWRPAAVVAVLRSTRAHPLRAAPPRATADKDDDDVPQQQKQQPPPRPAALSGAALWALTRTPDAKRALEQQRGPVLPPQPTKRRPRPPPMTPPPAPPTRPVFVLVGPGGRGVGKRVHVGKRAHFEHIGKSSWARMSLVDSGETVSWRAMYLRRVLPGGDVAPLKPSLDELQRAKAFAAQAPQAAQAAPPPPRAPLPGLVAGGTLLVMLDIEKKMNGPVHQLAAAALVRRAADGCWVEASGPRLSLQGGISSGDMARALLAWLEAQSAAAGGAPILALAHNGVQHDWPAVCAMLHDAGLQMPPCVVGLGCTRHLFVAERSSELGGKWSMQFVHLARFGVTVPNAHTAAGDVEAMMRICADVQAQNGAAYVERMAMLKSGAKPPAEFVADLGLESVLLLPPPQVLVLPTVIEAPLAASAVQPEPIAAPVFAPAVDVTATPRSASAGDGGGAVQPSAADDEAAFAALSVALADAAASFVDGRVQSRAALQRAVRRGFALLRDAAPMLERVAHADRAAAPLALARALTRATAALQRQLARMFGEEVPPQ